MTNNSEEMPTTQEYSPGKQLRMARESLGKTIQMVADELRLPDNYIQWIEEGAYEKFPGLVFCRGYIRSYARLLEVDAEQLVAKFDHQHGISQHSSKPIQSVTKVQQQVELGHSRMKFSVLIFVVLLIALTFWWWKTQYGLAIVQQPVVDAPIAVETTDGNELILPPLQDEQPVEQAAAAELQQEPEPVDLTPEQVEMLKQQLDAGKSASVAPVVNTEKVELNLIAAAPVPAPVESPKPVLGPKRLQIVFNNDCWVTIKDAKGKTLFNNLRTNGQKIDVTGAEPLRVNIGRANTVAKITYGGEAVDISRVSRNNIAKFKLPLSQ